jgi:3-deoxy-D-manno-octulosonic-acid transferase
LIPPRLPSSLLTALLFLAYTLFALLSWPVLLPFLLLKKKWRPGLAERFGFVPRLPPHPCRIWIHAISVGECEAALPLVAALRTKFPAADLVISTTTRTGRARAAKLFPGLTLFHYPFDCPWAVRRSFRRIRPALIVEVEPEWWPSFLFIAAQRRIPLAAVNVRITEKSLRGYLRVRPLAAAMINAASLVAVQNDQYRDRLLTLGVDPDRLRVTGQMKYDNVTGESVPGAADLARDLHLTPDDLLLVAGSTGPGEEEILLAAYAALKPRFPALRLALVPRKPERFDEVARLITTRGLHLLRRSETCATAGLARRANAPDSVILGDTMGELMKFYQLARLAFIGRSLIPLGGSNPIDPASLGLPLLFGPHMFNFPESGELFLASGAARVVTDTDSLAAALADLLQSPDHLAELGRQARAAVLTRRGATDRNLALLSELFSCRS